MANKLEITDIVFPSRIGFPVKTGTWDFLQLAHQEEVDAIVKNLIGINFDTDKIYILYGCKSSVSGVMTHITAGALYYQGSDNIGEIFQVPSQVIGIPGGGNTIVLQKTVSSYNPVDALSNPTADPVQFISGPLDNVHNIWSITFQVASPGSGFTLDGNSDFGNLVSVDPLFSSDGISYGSGCANFGTPFYDVSYKVDKNECSLSGVIACTAIASSVSVITLPVIARPSKKLVVYVHTEGGIGSFNKLIINTDGTCVFLSGGGDSGDIYLDNITFRLN